MRAEKNEFAFRKIRIMTFFKAYEIGKICIPLEFWWFLRHHLRNTRKVGTTVLVGLHRSPSTLDFLLTLCTGRTISTRWRKRWSHRWCNVHAAQVWKTSRTSSATTSKCALNGNLVVYLKQSQHFLSFKKWCNRALHSEIKKFSIVNAACLPEEKSSYYRLLYVIDDNSSRMFTENYSLLKVVTIDNGEFFKITSFRFRCAITFHWWLVCCN